MASTLCVTCFQTPHSAAAAPISPYSLGIVGGLKRNWSGQVRNAASSSSWRSGAIGYHQINTPFCANWRVSCSENRVEEEVMVEEREEEDVEFDISRLEKYTERVPNEVLRVHATVDGEEDQVIIFKVKSISFLFSSLLFHAIWKEWFGQDAHMLYLLLPFWLGIKKLKRGLLHHRGLLRTATLQHCLHRYWQ